MVHSRAGQGLASAFPLRWVRFVDADASGVGLCAQSWTRPPLSGGLLHPTCEVPIPSDRLAAAAWSAIARHSYDGRFSQHHQSRPGGAERRRRRLSVSPRADPDAGGRSGGVSGGIGRCGPGGRGDAPVLSDHGRLLARPDSDLDRYRLYFLPASRCFPTASWQRAPWSGSSVCSSRSSGSSPSGRCCVGNGASCSAQLSRCYPAASSRSPSLGWRPISIICTNCASSPGTARPLSPTNSVNGILNALIGTTNPLVWDANGFPPYNPIVYLSSLATAIILMGAALWPRAGRSALNGLLDFQFAALAFTMAAPIAWEHHYGIMAPILATPLLPFSGRPGQCTKTATIHRLRGRLHLVCGLRDVEQIHRCHAAEPGRRLPLLRGVGCAGRARLGGAVPGHEASALTSGGSAMRSRISSECCGPGRVQAIGHSAIDHRRKMYVLRSNHA